MLRWTLKVWKRSKTDLESSMQNFISRDKQNTCLDELMVVGLGIVTQPQYRAVRHWMSHISYPCALQKFDTSPPLQTEELSVNTFFFTPIHKAQSDFQDAISALQRETYRTNINWVLSLLEPGDIFTFTSFKPTVLSQWSTGPTNNKGPLYLVFWT